VPEPITVFAWEELASDTVCQDLAALAGVAPVPVERLRPVVAHILAHAGGLSAVVGEPDEGARDALAMRLLADGLCHALAELGFRVERRGSTLVAGRIVARDRVDVNAANEAELEALPVIGPVVAAAIVAGRRADGPYRSAGDLADRVAGLSHDNVGPLESALAFTTPSDAARTLPGGALAPADRLSVLTSLYRGDDPSRRLLRALETVATICGDSPHPASAERRMRSAVGRTPNPHPANRVHVLDGSAYYRALLELFAAATESISVAMFHIALPEPQHPTRALLDALAAAVTRGAQVRVLADRDQASDPYKSEIINRPALEYLQARGVDCRSDQTQHLLHSKFVVLDDARTIIGSHNWSAGSYFHFDDTSVLIESAGFANQTAQRFDALWDSAAP
jgi:hypothetical protein